MDCASCVLCPLCAFVLIAARILILPSTIYSHMPVRKVGGQAIYIILFYSHMPVRKAGGQARLALTSSRRARSFWRLRSFA